MESLQKYIIPAISENRKMDFIPACHGSLYPAFLSYKKYVSIFHLPPFRMHIVDYKMYRLVEDAVFMPFIFHPHLPSSTRCFRGHFSSNYLENKWIYPISYPLISLKAFHFPYSL